MNKTLLLLVVSVLLFSCKEEDKLTLADFIDLEQIEQVEMRDDISKYYLNQEQLNDFKERFGKLEQSEIDELDSSIYKTTITFNGKEFKINTSLDGELIQIPSSWINTDTIKSTVFKTNGVFNDFPANKRIKIYAISGLGADSRVFNELDLAAEIVALEWITPEENEPIEEYAVRLSKKINTTEEFAMMGVSFGGLVTTEISKFIKPNYTILLSTVETKDEMKPLFKFVGKHDLDEKLPAKAFDPSPVLANFLFSAEKKAHLSSILEDTDPKFSKWAIHEMMNWKNETRIQPVLKISGTKDRVIPAPERPEIHLIEGTGHFMIVDRAYEVSQIINSYIVKQQNEQKPRT